MRDCVRPCLMGMGTTFRRTSFGLVIAVGAMAVGGCASRPQPSYWVPLSEYRARQEQRLSALDFDSPVHRSPSAERVHFEPPIKKAVPKHRRQVAAASPVALEPLSTTIARRGPDAFLRSTVAHPGRKEVTATPVPVPSEPAPSPEAQVLNAGSTGAPAELARARENFGQGQVLAAREIMLTLFGNKSAEVSNQILMLELGRTFDPWYLGQLPSPDVTAEPMRAQYYYEEAKLLGSVDATTDLQRILGRAASNKPDSSGEGAEPAPASEPKSMIDTDRGGR